MMFAILTFSGVREGAEFSISVTSCNYTIFRQKEEDKEVSLNFEPKKVKVELLPNYVLL
jgi:hypothetical protein